MIPDPSGELAELIVYITSTRVDLYSHQILFAITISYFIVLVAKIYSFLGDDEVVPSIDPAKVCQGFQFMCIH